MKNKNLWYWLAGLAVLALLAYEFLFKKKKKMVGVIPEQDSPTKVDGPGDDDYLFGSGNTGIVPPWQGDQGAGTADAAPIKYMQQTPDIMPGHGDVVDMPPKQIGDIYGLPAITVADPDYAVSEAARAADQKFIDNQLINPKNYLYA